MKKTIALILALLLVCSGALAAPKKADVGLIYNGTKIYMVDSNGNMLPVYLENGHVYVPLDALVDTVGGEWSTEDKNFIFTLGTAAADDGSVSDDDYNQALDTVIELADIYDNIDNKLCHDILLAWAYGSENNAAPVWDDFVNELYIAEDDLKAGFSFQGDMTEEEYFENEMIGNSKVEEYRDIAIRAYKNNGTIGDLQSRILNLASDVGKASKNYPSIKQLYLKTKDYYSFAIAPGDGVFDIINLSIEKWKGLRAEIETLMLEVATDLELEY